MNNAEFLLDQVQVALKEMMRTVQGQFLSYQSGEWPILSGLEESGRFRPEDPRTRRCDRKSDLNLYFFDALRQALNLSDTTYLTGHSIWFYELPWTDHKVTRPGYLFFGPPDERTTAQPPRDFYVYLLPPFFDRKWQDDKFSDEVIFYLSGLDQEFEDRVRLYAGARAMAHEFTEYRQEYANKADEHLRTTAALAARANGRKTAPGLSRGG